MTIPVHTGVFLFSNIGEKGSFLSKIKFLSFNFILCPAVLRVQV